LLIRKGCSKYF